MRAQKGFTLVECLVALAIMSIALIALLEVFSRGNAAYRSQEGAVQRMELAQSRLDMLSASPYLEPESDVEIVADGRFTVHTDIVQIAGDDLDEPALYRLSVSVMSAGNTPGRETRLVTYEARQ